MSDIFRGGQSDGNFGRRLDQIDEMELATFADAIRNQVVTPEDIVLGAGYSLRRTAQRLQRSYPPLLPPSNYITGLE